MSNSTTLTVRGFKVRSQSRRRYIVVAVSPQDRASRFMKFRPDGSFDVVPTNIKAGARIHKRSDNLQTARKHAQSYGYQTGGSYAVVVDTYTGEEV